MNKAKTRREHHEPQDKRNRAKSFKRLSNFPSANGKDVSYPENQRYWNEFDDGSEGEQDDTYILYIDPDASSGFPGAAAIATLYNKLLGNLKSSTHGIFSLSHDSEIEGTEREPLLRHDIDIESSDTSDDDAATIRPVRSYPSSSRVQRYMGSQSDTILHRCCISFLMISLVLLVAAAALLSSGIRETDSRIQAGVIGSVLLALSLAVIGSGCMVGQKTELTWRYRWIVLLTDVCVLLAGLTLLIVASNPLR